MKRRQFITLLGGAAAAWPLAARAQQRDRMRRLGVLLGSPNDAVGHANATALVQGLGALGWQEGSNLRIALRWFGGIDPVLFERYVAEVFAFGPRCQKGTVEIS
jgi:putative tryptophan/tyrosine transport system substrate-binding protein